jgi:hypothetical protein
MEATVVIATMAVTVLALAGIARRGRRGGVAGVALAGAMAAYNEAWHTTAYVSHVELQAQADRVAPSDSPEDVQPCLLS